MPSLTSVSMPRRREATSSASSLKRGRPPKKAFINVLVRTSTRAALTELKTTIGLPSQGEVIDYLIELAHRRPSRR